MPDAFERVLARRDRKRRNERIAAGFVGAAVFALVALWFVRLLSAAPTPAVPRPEPAPPRNGKWVVISVSSLDPGARPMSRGKPANLFLTGPDGSARLLAGAEGDSTLQQCPAFSPDGSKLAYGQTGLGEKTVVVSGFSSAGELEEPTSRIPVAWAPSFVGPCPVWAPDGQRLATIAPGLGVLIVDLDGTKHFVALDAYGLVEGSTTGTLPLRWSPDGSQLALLVPSWAKPRDRLAHPRRRRAPRTCWPASTRRRATSRGRRMGGRSWRSAEPAARRVVRSPRWSTWPPATPMRSRSRRRGMVPRSGGSWGARTTASSCGADGTCRWRGSISGGTSPRSTSRTR